MKSKMFLVATIFGLTNLAAQTADKTFMTMWNESFYKACYKTCYYKTHSDQEMSKQETDSMYDCVHGRGAAAIRDKATNKKILSNCKQKCLEFLPTAPSDSYLRTLKKQAKEEERELAEVEARAYAIIDGKDLRAIIPAEKQRWMLRERAAYESRNNK